jgi:hypothetical protein
MIFPSLIFSSVFNMEKSVNREKILFIKILLSSEENQIILYRTYTIYVSMVISMNDLSLFYQIFREKVEIAKHIFSYNIVIYQANRLKF